jgi:perosamine synthetase
MIREPVVAFEDALARRLGETNAVAVTYARLGLRLLLDALGARAGDEIVLSALTCRVVVLAVQSLGLHPVFADVQPGGMLNMDPESLRRCLTSRTRAIVFQHTFGTSDGADAVAAIAAERGIPLIDDCAQCLPHSPTSTFVRRGIASIWSHNLRKPLPLGAGGTVATSDHQLAEAVRGRRRVGTLRTGRAEASLVVSQLVSDHLLRPWSYWPLWSLARWIRGDQQARSLEQVLAAEVSSLPLHISSRQADWGLRGLKDVDRRLAHGRQMADWYRAALGSSSHLSTPSTSTRDGLYYFPILSPEKPRLLDAARARRIELIAWPLSTPIYPVERGDELEQCEYQPGSCPNAEKVAASLCGIPLDLHANRSRAQATVDVLLSALANIHS